MSERVRVTRAALREFIGEAQTATYPSGESGVKEHDGSTSFVHESGPWRYHDNFFGGEPFGGREVVFHNGRPFWMMVYYGYTEVHVNPDEVFSFLRKALSCNPRAPLENVEVGYMERPVITYDEEEEEIDSHYVKTWDGDIDSFRGEEEIIMDDEIVYHGWFAGGLVDRK